MVKKILTRRCKDRKGTQSLPHVIINASIMANKKWKNITRGLLENFLQKVLALLNITISSYERAFLRFLYYIVLIILYDPDSSGRGLS